jgi:5-(hydroxymethyl)furfural/furfural oxidase
MDLKQSFDVIIVGAGSAGAILAARLSENPDRQVLLIEAGPDYRAHEAPEEMRSPNPQAIIDPDTFPDYSWPELLVRRHPVQPPRYYGRGRGPGGSSAINFQMAHRAPLEDFDEWAAQGCTGWSGEELLPAMNRLERDLDFGDAPYHGDRGPVTIYRPPVSTWGKVDLALMEACLDAGHSWHEDLNAPGSTGIHTMPLNRTAEDRMSTAVAYLEPARDRPNLTIIGACQADRVIFDRNRAIGVRAILNAEPVEFHADEVVLSAGSTFTPPILIRSGVGPEAQVRDLELGVVSNLPVGKNVCDHAAISVLLNLDENARCQHWTERNSNCLTRYSSGMPGTGANDMTLISMNLGGYNEAGLETGLLGFGLWETHSRGELRVTSADPFAMPEIDENLLSDERDFVRLREGTRHLFEVAESRAVRSVVTDVMLTDSVSGALDKRPADLRNDRDLDAWLINEVRDTWHLVGTCRMGSPDDPRTVVDPECRVLGVENLRVIDGSIMPDVTRANTNLTCMTIAEHMAPRLM